MGVVDENNLLHARQGGFVPLSLEAYVHDGVAGKFAEDGGQMLLPVPGDIEVEGDFLHPRGDGGAKFGEVVAVKDSPLLRSLAEGRDYRAAPGAVIPGPAAYLDVVRMHRRRISVACRLEEFY